MDKIDLVGVFYNEEYLLRISLRYIQLNTNIGEKHKPFYSKVLWKEKYEFISQSTKIQLSENLWLANVDDALQNITLEVPNDEISLSLIRFK